CGRTGTVLAVGQSLDAGYWRSPDRPRLAEVVAVLEAADCSIVLEMGEAGGEWLTRAWPTEKVPALKDGGLMSALARLYVLGVTPDFRAFDAPWPRRELALP